jgi:hypothetical protein
MDTRDRLFLVAILSIHKAVSAQGILLCELAKQNRDNPEVLQDIVRLTEANIGADEALDKLQVYLQ